MYIVIQTLLPYQWAQYQYQSVVVVCVHDDDVYACVLCVSVS
jgi:hypothetical protein